jgi:uncharacterized Zn-binding protein involved in type VI secretion
MPACAVAELIDKIATGHPCTGTAPIQGTKQTKVTIGGKLVAVDGDAVQVHTIKVGKACVPHSVTVSATTTKVFIGGDAVCRIGDPADAAGIISGSGKVMIGG